MRTHLCKVFTRGVLRHGIQVVRELAGGAGLTRAIWIELAGDVGCVCERRPSQKQPSVVIQSPDLAHSLLSAGFVDQ